MPGRPGGINSHPWLIDWQRALFAAIPGPPSLPSDPPGPIPVPVPQPQPVPEVPVPEFQYREEEIAPVDQAVNAAYLEAQRPKVEDRYADAGSGVWVARFLVNRQTLTAYAAFARIWGELRAGLGLAPDATNPFPPDPQ